jgi:hypothetical protein
MNNHKIKRAFQQLRCEGYFAAEDWACCQTCGWSEIDKLVIDRDHAVFYHGQDADRLIEEGSCYVAWRGDGDVISKTLNRYGIQTEWDGTEHSRILMTP